MPLPRMQFTIKKADRHTDTKLRDKLGKKQEQIEPKRIKTKECSKLIVECLEDLTTLLISYRPTF